jgi:hypothetical protein
MNNKNNSSELDNIYNMTKYEFKCPKCQEIKEILVTSDIRYGFCVYCELCKEDAVGTIINSDFQLKGL